MKPLVAIVGPTGAGKTSLAVKIAPHLDAEIIGLDSRQVYRYLDIGTAKPGQEERTAVPHHLIDIIKPDRKLSLADYQEMAYKTIDDILARSKIPFLVGGTGQYFWGVVEGWEVPRVPPELEMREQLEKEVATVGIEKLFAELQSVDPESARKIDPHNTRRVIRALEVFRSKGVPFSSLQNKKTPRYNAFIIGLTMEREQLYARVDARVNAMIDRGLVNEVKNLRVMGYKPDLPAMSGIGYKEVGDYLDGKIPLAEAVQRVKFETHRYIRQQYAWFRLKDERIHWLKASDNAEPEAIRLIRDFLK
jgi:tRNA dimethylallyltransferase